MVNAYMDKLPQLGHYRIAWEVYDLQEAASGLFKVHPIAYYKDAQTALLRACGEGYSVRITLLEETDRIHIVD